MGYIIETLSVPETIKVTVQGKLDLSEKEEIYFKSMDALIEKGYHRLLFDVRCGIENRNYSVGHSIDLFNTLNKRPLQENVKLAYLSSDDQTSHQMFGVYIKIIANITVKHFIAYDEAVQWLCEEF